MQYTAQRLIDTLGTEEVQKAFGRLSAVETQIDRWLTQEADMPKEVIEALFTLGVVVDENSRIHSGAALTPSEVAFYTNLLGSPFRDPSATKLRAILLIENMDDAIRGVYDIPLSQKFGSPDKVPQYVFDDLPIYANRSPQRHKENQIFVDEGPVKNAAFYDGMTQAQLEKIVIAEPNNTTAIKVWRKNFKK